MTTHQAWDSGLVQNSVTAVLGWCPNQKTTKTLCGKRVPMAKIDNDDPSCTVCRQRMQEEHERQQKLEGMLRQYQAKGLIRQSL